MCNTIHIASGAIQVLIATRISRRRLPSVTVPQVYRPDTADIKDFRSSFEKDRSSHTRLAVIVGR